MPKKDYASLFTRRSDGRYVATYTDEAGRHYVYDRDPERLYRRLNRNVEPEEPTFREVAERWERTHRQEISGRTWANYAPHYQDILLRHGDESFSSVTVFDVTQHLAQAKAKGYSATVVNTIRSLYAMIWDAAVVEGAAPVNPVSSVKLPRGLKRGKRRAPEDEQIRIILSGEDAPFGLFPLLLLCTGLRKAEALALTWDDIDLVRKQISVTKALDFTVGAHPTVKTPKTEAGVRTVPIVEILLPVLTRAKERSASPLLFPPPPSTRGGSGGGYMTERAYEGAWLRYCQAVGLMDGEKPAITAHHLRHGTATLMFESGVDELTAQRILGHSRPEITREIYTDLRQKMLSKSVRKFDQAIKKMSGNM